MQINYGPHGLQLPGYASHAVSVVGGGILYPSIAIAFGLVVVAVLLYGKSKHSKSRIIARQFR